MVVSLTSITAGPCIMPRFDFFRFENWYLFSKFKSGKNIVLSPIYAFSAE